MVRGSRVAACLASVLLCSRGTAFAPPVSARVSKPLAAHQPRSGAADVAASMAKGGLASALVAASLVLMPLSSQALPQKPPESNAQVRTCWLHPKALMHQLW
jgi:hypothetical protein